VAFQGKSLVTVPGPPRTEWTVYLTAKGRLAIYDGHGLADFNDLEEFKAKVARAWDVAPEIAEAQRRVPSGIARFRRRSPIRLLAEEHVQLGAIFLDVAQTDDQELCEGNLTRVDDAPEPTPETRFPRRIHCRFPPPHTYYPGMRVLNGRKLSDLDPG
jgi:hypothetical protein